MTLEESFKLIFAAHDSIGHKRKYSGLPYTVHLKEVADIVREIYPLDTEVIIAAAAHDVAEDVFPVNSVYSFEWLTNLFGARVARIVDELTDVYTHEAYPKIVRRERKALEAARLGKVSPEAQTVKVADLISNSADIVANDPGFAKTYLREKELVLRNLTKADTRLLARAWKQVVDGKVILGLDGV